MLNERRTGEGNEAEAPTANLASPEETQKRLSYALPMIETLIRLAQAKIEEKAEIKDK